MSQQIKVSRVLPNRNGKKDFPTLELRVEREKTGTSNSVVNMFLENPDNPINNTEKLVAFQTISQHQVDKFGIKEGTLLNDVMPQPLKLVVSEITHSEFNALPESLKVPYSPKQNPTTEEYLVDANGETIFRGILVRAEVDSIKDVYLSHSGSTPDAPEYTKGISLSAKTSKTSVADEIEDELPA